MHVVLSTFKFKKISIGASLAQTVTHLQLKSVIILIA